MPPPWLQVDVMHVRVYKAVGLSAEQRRFLAEFWSTWVTRRRNLDKDLAAALTRASMLPGPAHIPTDTIAALDAAIAAPPRGESVYPLYELDSDDRSSSDDPSYAVDPSYSSDPSSPAAPPFFVPRQLLGMSARSTRAAEDVFLSLVAVHRRDARQMEDFQSGFVLPAWFLRAEQRARLNCAHVRHECVPMEMLALCRMAAVEQRRGSLRAPFTWKLP